MGEEIIITTEYQGMRLDRFLRSLYNIPQGLIEKSLRKKDITLNNKKAEASSRINIGDIVFLHESLLDLKAEKNPITNLNLDLKQFNNWIIFENNDLVIINKPYGIATQGGTKVGVSIDDYLKQINHTNQTDYKLVHRLDKHTTGCLLIAKNRIAAVNLTGQFKEKTIKKTYLALCINKPKKDYDFITFDDAEQGLMETEYKLISYNKEYNISLLSLSPITGKKHQLRIICAELGFPIIGDDKYNALSYNLPNKIEKKLMLHCWKKDFIYDNISIKIKADISKHFELLLDIIKENKKCMIELEL